jgi:ATP-binding cassette subfamily F protein uup
MLTLGGKPLLEGADFAVATGARLCVVGRNGSGKSTLLKIAAGEIEPDGGVLPAARAPAIRQSRTFRLRHALSCRYLAADDPHVARTCPTIRGSTKPRAFGRRRRRAALSRSRASLTFCCSTSRRTT